MTTKRQDKGKDKDNSRSLRDDNKKATATKDNGRGNIRTTSEQQQNNGEGGLAAVGGDGCLLHDFEGDIMLCGGGAAVFELGCGVEDFAVA